MSSPQAPACSPASKLSYAVCPDDRLNSSHSSPTSPACRLKCKQISELIAVTTQTIKWMQDQQARSIEIDKTLAELRANLVAFQSASCHLSRQKAPALTGPCQRLQDPQASLGGPLRLKHPARVLVVLLFPSLREKRQKPFFSPAQKAPTE